MKRVAVLLAVLSCVPFAAAQAWLPDKGEGYFTFSFAHSEIGDHYFSETPWEFREIFDAVGFVGIGTDKVDLGNITSRAVVAGGGYAFAERWAVDGTIAYVEASYVGPLPEDPVVDDGKTRGDLQDATVRFRWQALDGKVKLAPFVGVVVPITDYQPVGHANIGRGLTEYSAGVSVGRAVGAGGPTGFVQASYFYTYPQKYDGERTDSSNLLMEFGYFLTRRFTARFNVNLQETHGGIDWATDVLEAEQFHAHDVNADADHRALGGSLFFEASPSIDLVLSYQRIVSGDNSHELGSWTGGLVYAFGGRDRLITNTLPTGER